MFSESRASSGMARTALWVGVAIGLWLILGAYWSSGYVGDLGPGEQPEDYWHDWVWLSTAMFGAAVSAFACRRLISAYKAGERPSYLLAAAGLSMSLSVVAVVLLEFGLLVAIRGPLESDSLWPDGFPLWFVTIAALSVALPLMALMLARGGDRRDGVVGIIVSSVFVMFMSVPFLLGFDGADLVRWLPTVYGFSGLALILSGLRFFEYATDVTLESVDSLSTRAFIVTLFIVGLISWRTVEGGAQLSPSNDSVWLLPLVVNLVLSVALVVAARTAATEGARLVARVMGLAGTLLSLVTISLFVLGMLDALAFGRTLWLYPLSFAGVTVVMTAVNILEPRTKIDRLVGVVTALVPTLSVLAIVAIEHPTIAYAHPLLSGWMALLVCVALAVSVFASGLKVETFYRFQLPVLREKSKLSREKTLDVVYQVLKNPMGVAGIAILALFVFLALFGPAIAPYDTSNLGLGKWQKPSVFATDTPPSFEYLVMLLPCVSGLVLSVVGLMAALARVKSWRRLNKLILVAAISLSALALLLVTHDYFVSDLFAGRPWWIYTLSMTGVSLAMVSLGTRKRVNVARRRARYVGIIASMAPIALVSVPAVVAFDASSLHYYLLAAYVLSGFVFVIAGVSFARSYRVPPAVEMKPQGTLMPRKLDALARLFAVVACFTSILTGLMVYFAGNWTAHWMGTDTFGADILSQLLYGARTSMIVGIFSAIIASVLGALVGLYSGYVGGGADEVIMRANDIVLSIPWLVLMIIVAAMLGTIDLTGMILIIGLTGWSPTARMVRAQVLSIKERQYIERARAIGSSNMGIISKHILPNSFPLVFANTILTVAVSILSEATLSFLGMRPIGVTTWGTMLSYASDSNAFAIGLHWWIIAPGLCIVFVVLGFTLLGYALDDVLNPKLRKR